jgi:uncharacterized membrane protein
VRGLALAAAVAASACGAPEDPCADQPVVTWETFGEGFLIERCQACHASTAPATYGVPAGVHFDTEDQARARADRILEVATGASPTMPPQGGVSADDRERLRVWLSCW